eukprot:sb/3471676/
MSRRNLGEFTKAEVKFLIKCADKDENGKMDCSEFVLMMAALYVTKIRKIRELRDAFKYCDQKGRGYVDVKDLRRLMSKNGFKLSKQDCQDMLDEADIDGDGKMSFFEFVLLMENTQNMAEDEAEKALYEVFQAYDLNGDGTIDRSELGNALKQLAVDTTPDEIDTMFKEAIIVTCIFLV